MGTYPGIKLSQNAHTPVLRPSRKQTLLRLEPAILPEDTTCMHCTRPNRGAATGVHAVVSSLKSVLLAAVLLASPAANAGRILDQIRNQDLNDYALGISLTASASPYAGVGSSNYAYPYLTSFQHPAFTRDWLLLRDENLGIRYVSDSEWELGVVGRVQTLGLGASNSDILQGLNDRDWSAELGPLIGWRGWPVHFQLRSYLEVPNRHSGSTSEFEASLPLHFSRGYFVPSARLRYMSSAYSDYYYGVDADEAALSRPVYTPGSATNMRLGFSLGYELTPRWLLKASAGIEFLDDRIAASPIVDKDRIWSASIGAAYNANLFQPRDHDDTAPQRALEIRASAFNSVIATDARYDNTDGSTGDGVGFEEFLGVSDRENVLQLDIYYRLAYYHRLDLSLFEINRSTNATLQRDFDFGDETFLAGTPVNARFDTRRLRLAYSYSLMRDSQKELGVSLGVSYARLEVELAATDTGQQQRALIDTPLPTMGLFGSVALRGQWQLAAELGLFALEFDRYEGYSGHAILNLDRRFSEHVSAGVGYNFYATRLNAGDDDYSGLLRTRNHGPKVFISWHF